MLPFSAFLLPFIPLMFPLRALLGVPRCLDRTFCSTFPPDSQNVLPDLAVDLREFGSSNLGLEELLQLDSEGLQFI